MNPLGLLIAYAEKEVKPVVSDMEPLLIGSRGMTYQPTPDDQVELMSWCLRHTKAIMESQTSASWNTRWLQVLNQEKANGFAPETLNTGLETPRRVPLPRTWCWRLSLA